MRFNGTHLLAVASMLLAAATVSAAADGEKQSVSLRSGIQMRYVVAGPESGPPLVLLHGLGDTSRSYSLVLPDLARRYRVYVPDQRGHGDTEAPACCYALADLAYDVIAFLDAMKVEKASVAGHSMGSFVAQHLAFAYPQRVTRLVLLGSSDTAVGTEIMGWLWDKTKGFGRGADAAFVDEWQSNPTPVNAEFLARVKIETAAVPTHVWRGVARTLSTEDQRRFLGDIQVPTLILWGEKDAVFTKDNQERLQKAIAGAAFKAYPEVGHNLHWEVPQRIAEDIAAFLK